MMDRLLFGVATELPPDELKGRIARAVSAFLLVYSVNSEDHSTKKT